MINIKKSVKETPLRNITDLGMFEGFTEQGEPIDIWVIQTRGGDEFAFAITKKSRIIIKERINAYREKPKK